MPDHKLHFLRHFMQRQSQRKFTDDQAKRVIDDPEKKTRQRSGHWGGTVYVMEKHVDGKKLVVVAELRDNEAYLITAYFPDE